MQVMPSINCLESSIDRDMVSFRVPVHRGKKTGSDMVLHLANGEILSRKITIAGNYPDRLRGLLGRKEILADEALIIKPCCQIHTFFMRFSIDVIFLDRYGSVMHVMENMPPWRVSRLVPSARMAVELPGGILQGRVAPGDILKLEE